MKENKTLKIGLFIIEGVLMTGGLICLYIVDWKIAVGVFLAAWSVNIHNR